MALTPEQQAIVELQRQINDLKEQEKEKDLALLSSMERKKKLLQEETQARNEILSNLERESAELESLKNEYTSASAARKIQIEAEIADAQARIQSETTILGIISGQIEARKKEIEEEQKAAKKREVVQAKINEALSIADTIYKRIKQELLEIDTLSAKLVASTGHIFNNFSIGGIGVGVKQFYDGLEGLYSEMSKFSDLDRNIKNRLATSAAELTRIGISAATSGKNLDLLNKGLGMSAIKADAMQRQLVKSAAGAGIVPKKMLEDFGSAMGKLGVYGEKGVQIFDKMEKQAKALGLQVSDLNDVFGSQMDTFEGAGQIVGDLNSMFGQNIFNVKELIGANEAERAVIVKKKLAMMGVSAETEKFNKLALMNALHIKDATTFNKLFNGSMTEMEVQANKKAATDQQLNNILARTIPLMEKLSLMWQKLALIFMPVFDMVVKLVDWFGKIFDKISNFGKVTILIIGIIGALVVSLLPVYLAGKAFALGMTAVATSAAGASVGLSALIPFLLTTALVVVGVGVAIGGTVLAIGYMMSKFEGLNKIGAETAASFLLIAAGISAIMFAASNPIGIAGLAALAAVGGVALGMTAIMTGNSSPTAQSPTAGGSAAGGNSSTLLSSIDSTQKQSLTELKEMTKVMKEFISKERRVAINIDGKTILEAVEKAQESASPLSRTFR
jgi:hypothetical protein